MKFPRKLLLPLSLALLVSCSDPVPPNLAELQKSRESLQIENDRLKEKTEADALRLRNLEEDLRVKTKDWSDRSTKISEESRARQEQVELLTAKNQELTTALEGFRRTEKVEARTEARGGQVAVLKTRNGDVYKNVTIRSVVPDGIHIVHETGATKILFTQLDSSWGDRFGYNTKEATNYAKAQAQERANARNAQAEALAAQQEQEGKKLEKNKSEYANRQNDADNQIVKQLNGLRGALWSELQQINGETKGKLNLGSQAEPENSPVFSNNLIALRLSRARDLRAQINELKSRIGSY